MQVRRALSLALVLSACALACVPAAKKPVEVRQADTEASSGDWESALEKYRVAAHESPNDAGIKKKVAEAERKCADIWAQRATQANAEGRIAEAADLWRRSLDVTPAVDRPKSPATRDVLANLAALEYAGESASAEGREADALTSFLVLEMAQPDRAGIQERVNEARKGFASHLVALSDTHWKRELGGASLAANIRALQYDPMQDKATGNANDLRRVLRKKTRFTLDGVKIEETGYKPLAAALTQKLGPRLDDYPPYGPWPVKDTGGRATLVATIAEYEKSELATEGVDEMPNTLAPKLDPVPNPDVALQKAKIERLEKKLADLQAKMRAEIDKKKKRKGAPPAKPGEKPPEDTGLLLARDIDKTRIDVASAKARLEQLPPTVIPPPPDPTWKLPWTRTIRTVKARVRFEFRDSDFADPILVDAAHDLEKSDRVHAGNGEQGIEPDPLKIPDWDEMIAELAEQLATEAVTAIEKAKKRRIDSLLAEGRLQQRSRNDAEATHAYVQLLFIVGPEALPADVAFYLENALENPRLKDVVGTSSAN